MKIYVISVVLFLLLTGCGGGGSSSGSSGITGGSSSSSVSSFQPVDMGSLFSPVDEQGLVDNPPADTVDTSASGGKAELTPVEDAVNVDGRMMLAEPDTGRTLVIDSLYVSAADVGKPLFVDNVFKGMITAVADNSGASTVTVKPAEKVKDVYQHFEIEAQNDGLKAAVKRSLARAIAKRQIVGKYDAINAHPLKISLVERPEARSVDDTMNGLVLRIEIPKGYKIPVEPRDFDCSFTQASCKFTSDFTTKRKTDLKFQYERDFITVDSTGSFIEIGVGEHIYAYYDHNTFSDDVFKLKAGISAYFKSNLTIKVSANLAAKLKEDGLKWEKDIQLLKDFKIFIPTPASEAVQTWVTVSPHFEFGFEGKLSGTVTYKHEIDRQGEVRVDFDTTTGTHRFYSNASDKAANSTKDSLSVGVEAEARFFLFPNLTYVPSITFYGVNEHVSLVALQSGVNMDNTLLGKIEEGFVAENKEKYSSGPSTEVSLTSTLYGLIRGKWMVKIGSVVLYESDDGYQNILEMPKHTLLEWKMQLLNAPKLTVKNDPNDPESKLVYFTSDDSNVLGNLYFYYNIGDTVETTKDVPVFGIENNAQVWHTGDQPIVVKGNKVIKARALLHNADVSTSVWSWGTSVSAQRVMMVSSILPPTIAPQPQAFTDSLTITLSQPQGEDIFYKIDNGAIQKYTGPFDITDTATVTAYSEIKFKGQRVRSDAVTASYEKCGVGQKVETGMCVDLTCRDDDYACPVCTDDQALVFDNDGNGVCQDKNSDSNSSESGDTNNSKQLYTYDDWTQNCPNDLRQEIYTIGTHKMYGCFTLESTDITGNRVITKDLDYSGGSMTELEEEDDYLVLKNSYTDIGYKNYLVHTKKYNYDANVTDHLVDEVFYVLVASGGDYAQLLQKSTSWNEVYGYISSEREYAIKQNDDGTWANPQISEDGVDLGTKYKYEFDVFKDAQDGHWYSTMKKSIDYFMPLGITIADETEYIPKKDDDGTWRGIRAHTIGYSRNGNKVSETNFEVKKDEKYGAWVSIEKDFYIWTEEGEPGYEKHNSVLQNDDGTWTPILISEKSWYENGNISEEAKYTAVKEDTGFWSKQLISCTSYNRDGSAHECPTYD